MYPHCAAARNRSWCRVREKERTTSKARGGARRAAREGQ
jgi:hypothetical protein